jgi:protein-disulfide isomerase
MWKRFDFTTTFLVVCAGTMTTLAVHNAWPATRARVSAPEPPRELPNWQTLATASRAVDATRGPLTIIEFSDFQCPFCRELVANLDAVQREHPDSIRVVFRHSPLIRVHPFAWTMAVASECARRQGRFAEFYHAAFDRQDSIPRLPAAAFGQRAGVADTVAFNSCVAREETAPIVRADLATAESLHVRGTPGVIVNGRLYAGSPPLSELRTVVAAAFARH